MSKTHPSKSKTKAKSSPAKKAAAQTTAKKAAPKTVTKSAPKAKTPVKKASSKSPATKSVTKKVAAKKIAVKAPPAKKAVVAKKAVPVKKTALVTKSASVKKTIPIKKAVPAKKVPEPRKAAPAVKKAAPAPVPVPKKAPEKPAIKAAKVAPVKQVIPSPAEKTAPAKAEVPVPAKIEVVEVDLTPRVPVLSTEKPEATSSGALFYDSHMHTPLCKHAWGEPEEYAAQALKSGLKGIIFTCHCPMPEGFWPSVRMSDSEFDTYVSMVQRTADAYRGQLDVRLGLESEFFPGHEKWIAKLHQRADFDYILGAVHWQSKEYLAKFESGTIENFRRIYFEHLAQSAESGLYDCLAHPDLVKNYHPDSWCFAIIKKNVNSVLDRIAATGVAMELNTSGLNKSYAEMNPGNEMLRMMAERKIPVVLGSDSHKAVRVGEHFITALNNLREAGYEEVSYFKKRERIELKISDVLASIRKAIDHNS